MRHDDRTSLPRHRHPAPPKRSGLPGLIRASAPPHRARGRSRPGRGTSSRHR
jgi:hypothetical protein